MTKMELLLEHEFGTDKEEIGVHGPTGGATVSDVVVMGTALAVACDELAGGRVVTGGGLVSCSEETIGAVDVGMVVGRVVDVFKQEYAYIITQTLKKVIAVD